MLAERAHAKQRSCRQAPATISINQWASGWKEAAHGTVGGIEGKTPFPGLLERVAKGEEIVITRHGTPIAKLTPISGPGRERTRAMIARLKEFSRHQTLGGLSVPDLRDEGRR